MATRVLIQRIHRWTGSNATTSTFSPGYFKRYTLSFKCTGCRFLSSNDQPASVWAQHNQTISPAKLELSVGSLVDMGFTDAQAKRLYDSVSGVRGGKAAKQVLPTLTALFVLGLNPGSVAFVLDKCPELFTVEEAPLQQRIVHLRKLGLVEGSLQRLVVHYPKILTIPVKLVKNVVQFLKEKCAFTTQQITDILRESPTVVLEDRDQLHYKFQYVYFRMGVKQDEMVKCKLFRHTLEDVRNRQTFLERRGLYETPNKKGQTSIVNPTLNSILNVDQDKFVTSVAQASAEEYDVFQRLLAREWREEGLKHSIEAHRDDEYCSDDDDYEEEEEEEDEFQRKRGYLKGKKKQGSKSTYRKHNMSY